MRIVLKPAGLVLVLIGLFVAIVTPFLMMQRNVSRAASQQKGASRASSADAPAARRSPGGASANLLREVDWKFYTESDARATFKPLSGSGLPAAPAYHFDINRLGGQQWNIGFNNKIQGAEFRDSETVRVRFWGRSPNQGKICLILQKDAPPFPHCWKEYVSLAPQWKEYSFTFKPANYARGEAILAIFLSMDLGSIELAGLRLERAE
jgi:hypothetical protein